MCGIFAYIGDRQAAALLIAALKRLEYRGYDSAGIGIHGGETGKPLKVRKKVGKVQNLDDDCANAGDSISGTLGIAHTRWATHGKPSDVNSHPHTTADKSIAVVHNGVVENYQTLKKQLSNKGYKFVSETDTELLAHLVRDIRNDMPEATWPQVVATALQHVEGAWGVAFLFEDEPDLMIGARKGSPLILGVGNGEYMLASDASAIVEHTKDVVYLREGELVEVHRSGYKVQEIQQIVHSLKESLSPRSAREGQSVENPIVRLELSLDQIEKAGYPHFMLKEIFDQPNSLRNGMRGRIYNRQDKPDSWQIKLGGLEKALEAPEREGKSAIDIMASARRLIICACGTSWHSGLIAKYVLENLAKIPVEVEYASEFRYRNPVIGKDDVIIAISQSGETADTLEAIKMAKKNNAITVGIVNVVGSSIARETDAGIYLHAGPEIGVASTKAFTGQVIALLMVALRLATERGVMSDEVLDSYCEALNALPDKLESWFKDLNDQIKVISKYFRLASNALFSGCGIHFPVALEGALKLKEISYIHAEGFPAAEIRHGALTLIRNFVPVVCIAMKSDPAYEQVKAQISEFRAKDAAVIVLTDQENNDFNGIASFVIRCPATKLELEPLIVAIPLQLLSYYIADERGCSIDQPRNLAKSVTVE
ncbi:unnamed protein product [Polarella glacialis]|uniref:Glutamine--fructose-6-phosphate aminotransferase [isomerizing] n=1 Tax=Polarella glacialis TaxID=89957 RepID=A0A813HXW5_POLGL|nr:unnamed protein product [Polarella glacialis]CAE8642244.1 unnamed protein product [Polarella glacialis]|mmetsp:Transcript_32361/g.52071  ORF Transcript_32361/g.52071 Transcript_32361/m.52071 type:complete len:654 (+) Transcript_32361:75-2036(+)|eukprot:CAMPEP_0115115602 /NCGR_PEP_ID=MMETSP0227-20121206/42795_1 /TAXON_ID=89957 /ORGANISM="Polarella glacialis, Strain CCMP 1383" /LENGTH=653 /DNA_ID=CAMNT_0002516315 /DNA_START=77 /DNA_END=2038 /DNA_ORIENTATION=+